VGWASIKVAARLMIAGKEFECVRAGVSYELNSVPRALFMVAVGRGKSALTPAQIHRSTFSAQDKVQFYLTLTQLDGGSRICRTGNSCCSRVT
jgi:hypothetical protein